MSARVSHRRNSTARAIAATMAEAIASSMPSPVCRPRTISSPRPPAPTNVASVALPMTSTLAVRTPASAIGNASGQRPRAKIAAEPTFPGPWQHRARRPVSSGSPESMLNDDRRQSEQRQRGDRRRSTPTPRSGTSSARTAMLGSVRPSAAAPKNRRACPVRARRPASQTARRSGTRAPTPPGQGAHGAGCRRKAWPTFR